MIYDIIGDIHGQADKLKGLLIQLGYRHDGTSFIAPKNHQAIFIGDFIDRGHQQLSALAIIFDMLDNHQALAVMGNHEYNAIGHTLLCDDGKHLRPHTQKNLFTHKAFLDEVGDGTALHQYWIERFCELPLWLELHDCICVHACYDKNSMDTLKPILTNQRLTKDAIRLLTEKDPKVQHAIECLLKGIEYPLPHGHAMRDKTGIIRNKARVKWWMKNWQNLPINQTLLADGLPSKLPTDLTKELLTHHIGTKKPIFIGHYWLDGTPTPLSRQVVCVDYSVGKDGHLTAYQFDTDNPQLNQKNFAQYLSS